MPELVTCLLLQENGNLPEEVIEIMKDDEWAPLRGKSAFILKWPESIGSNPVALEDVTEKLRTMRLTLEKMGIRHSFSTIGVGNRDKVKMKVCLVGDKGVGKSSLIRRYVLDQFEDTYLRTMGSKVSKKTFTLEHPRDGRRIQADMTIWDIMGNKGLADLLMGSYLHGAQGIIAVCDVTRKSTLHGLGDWIGECLKIAGNIPVHILVNKADMHDNFDFNRKDVEEATSPVNAGIMFTSARTGDNVEEAFHGLALSILSTQLERDLQEKLVP
ncbi:MAG: Rab family GTPase [Thermoplasmata archaeon]